MNARIDLAISAGLAEEPRERSRPDTTAERSSRPETLLRQLATALAPLSTLRLQPSDCPGQADR
ncbi:hypothetical protein [Saccharopolyspora tripterygii]